MSMMAAVFGPAETLPVFVLGATGSLVAGLFTAVGALPVLVGKTISERTQNTLLGFAAGVMLAATVFSLIIPGIDQGERIYGGAIPAVLLVSAGILIGGLAIAVVNRYAPHEHFISGREGADWVQLRRLWLFVVAITLHNFPEGLAVGVSFAGHDIANGTAMATGIGLQNMPEGLAVAVALLSAGYSRLRSVAVAAATGLVEPIGGMIGAGAVSVAAPVLPMGLAFAAGAMLFVISNEIIPETNRKGYAGYATGGLMVGFVVMMQLDVVFA
jgi:ZIP family zinc transporter